MAKRQTSIRLSGLADMQISTLTKKLNMKQSEVITVAVDRFYKQVADGEYSNYWRSEEGMQEAAERG